VIVPVILIAVVAICAFGALLWTMDKHEAERELWAAERERLVNRAIARHAGEVVALDREGKPKPERDDKPSVYIEGLS
jgi:uncharacterized membrane protein YsdA (DUF1294 family)